MRERLFGGLSPRAFLRRHWQKRPLVVRAAWRPQPGLADLARLFALAARDDVEARCVLRRGARFIVEHGPLPPQRRGTLPARDWTLLVHGFNHHAAAAERLLRRFDFLPQARIDDVMASFAAPGGGVGAHHDRYDVFLLQGPGRRVWRLQRPGRFAPVTGAPLKLIAHFRPDEEILLEPGDLLYLPPGWGHDGIALEPCWTYSIGCRAPSAAELAVALLDELQERGLPDTRYRDPGLRPVAHSAAIGTGLLRYAQRVLARARWRRDDAARVLGRALTTPKPHVVFAPRRRPPSRRVFARRLARSCVALDPKSLLLYRGARYFLNGELLAPATAQRRILSQLADRRRAPGARLARAGLAGLLYDWYRSGFIHLERSP
jgi:50S ribosomal protein L16 3-hydroxylase